MRASPRGRAHRRAELYDAIYASKDYRAEVQQLATLIRQDRPGAPSVLDVACGTGEHAQWLTTDHGFSVDGIDLDDALLAVARRKVPAGRFMRADMEHFDLGRRYDAVLCLFSSIAYLVTLERVGQALDCFRRHVVPDGVVVVEPWFEPGVIDPTRVSRHTGTLAAGRVERVSQIEVDDRVSRIQNRPVPTCEKIRPSSRQRRTSLGDGETGRRFPLLRTVSIAIDTISSGRG